ncbi:hypothetical protein BFJ68_g15375 [Fusarium oxysporum]|uniref:Uncharacterized protein n=1 Tax=Fusarium oxysporum TaxID=5507 RepID=A0A420PN09_FUSOX|nr:hypothetical protein BFJ68_g15375 [Fusarium oxysporum]
MPSYLVTGASCGHGFGFIQVVSINPNNSLMSNKAATDKMLAEELSSPNNVHIFEADITDFNALKGAFEAVSEIAEGSLDYVIANAGLIALWSQWDAVDVLAKDPEHLVKQLQDSFNVNVIGNFHLFNLFTPLVLKGQGKKVIAISSGMSDIDFFRQFESSQLLHMPLAKQAQAFSPPSSSLATQKKEFFS